MGSSASAREIEVGHETGGDVFHFFDARGREIVQAIRILGTEIVRPSQSTADQRVTIYQRLTAQHVAAISVEQFHQQLLVHIGRVVVLDGATVTLLPMAHQICEQVRRPSRTALEEPDTKSREATSYSAEEQSLGQGVRGVGEMTDMVIHVVGNRTAGGPTHAGGMGGEDHFELDCLGPERVVIVFAVESVGIYPKTVLRDVGMLVAGIFVGERLDRTVNISRNESGLEAELLHYVFQLRYTPPLECAAESRRPGSSDRNNCGTGRH